MSSLLSGMTYRLFKKHSTIRRRQTFFSESVVYVWNYLPYDVVCFNSVKVFKRCIERVNSNLFLQRF